jgi:hypothetical protein
VSRKKYKYFLNTLNCIEGRNMKKFDYKTKPFEHQRTALKKGAQHGVYAYFMEMGTGKTKVAIDNALVFN